MNAMYNLEMISARAVGVKTYLRDPGMISSEKRRSESRSLWFEGGRREGKSADSADDIVAVVERGAESRSHERILVPIYHVLATAAVLNLTRRARRPAAEPDRRGGDGLFHHRDGRDSARVRSGGDCPRQKDRTGDARGGADPASITGPIIAEEGQLGTRLGDKSCLKNRERRGEGDPGRGGRAGQAAAGGYWDACRLQLL